MFQEKKPRGVLKIMDWPPHCQNLYTIEHLWKKFKAARFINKCLTRSQHLFRAVIAAEVGFLDEKSI